ncbi:TonB-linked outer membrane protein, SusC/RagA family [Chitinophaga jiangningensis]|uniref:TonB-linked outer membrane protein, SusC/RagA family n=1 Tax=Chitinophaga jiangningensis TaxID=1419482 RepID=A0A1M7J1V3_9BACT|nr:SusC/RagA family TonB-linked outer membrane protein [Chitinophaga jiangningensis]SHM46893.1 TonB-linked outer membrane protein, SusC/RagA family [Chitinophaga jiangningensis]
MKIQHGHMLGHWKRYACCLVLSAVQSLASAATAYSQKVDLKVHDARLDQVLASIRSQTGYSFVFDARFTKNALPVTIDLKDASFQQALAEVFKGQPFTYEVTDKIVTITSPTAIQQATITLIGRILSPDNQPVIGASITVQGTRQGSTANADGYFNLANVPDNATIVISSIGFNPLLLKLDNGNLSVPNRENRSQLVRSNTQNLLITLQPSSSQLQEVNISVGYGTQKRRETTSAISTIKGSQLQNKPSGSIEGLLQGLAPGLLVQNNSGMPGGRSMVQIRGLASFSNSANSGVVSTPLFIIDGVPLEQDVFNPSDPRQAITSVLAGFSPFDLESVEVLKDASATAIYGSRGANGVIIINTKRGKIGKPIVTLNTQYGLSYYPSLRKTLGGAAERNFKIALYNQYKSAKVGGGATDMPIELTDSLNGFYNNSTDWQKLYFRDADIKNVNLGISGATENASYRVGVDYYKEKGIVLGSGFSRFSLTYNGIFKPTSKLTITGRANLSQTDASQKRGDTYNAAVVGNNFSSSFRPGPTSGYFDAFLDSYSKGVNLDLTRRGLAQLEVSYDIFKFLNLTSRASGNYEFYRTRTFEPSGTRSDAKAAASYYSQEKVNLLSETFLRLYHTFPSQHSFDLTVGNTINTSENNNIYGAATGGPSDAQQVILGYPQANLKLETHNLKYGLLSYYSRLSYNYKKRYLLQGVIRADGSSKFGKDNQWGYFPSVSAGWVFTEENFLNKRLGNILNFGKIRASTGKSGTQYEDNYLAVGAYLTKSGDNATYNGVPLLAPNYAGGNGIALPNLTWQTTKDQGIGLDLEFFNSRITMALDYYNKNTDGFLFPDALNGTSGYSSRYVNSGAVRNYGYEAAITAYITKPNNNFQYSTTFIGAINRNELTKLPDFGRSVSRSGYAVGQPYLQIGRPLNGFYLMKYLGVYATDDEVPVSKYTGQKLYPNTSGFTSQDPYRAGDIKLLDVNGDGRIGVMDNTDRVYSGDPNPKFTGSFAHSFSYRFKNNAVVQLDLFFNYSVGNKVFNKVLADRIKAVSWTASENVNYPGGQRNLLDVSDLDFWTPEHTNAKYPVLNPWRYYGLSSYDFIGNYETNTDLFLEDGSFIRLNNINLSYDFSPAVLSRAHIRKLRVYGGMSNVFLLSKYSGVDPENVDSYGYDLGNGYPIPYKFNLGFNFEF